MEPEIYDRHDDDLDNDDIDTSAKPEDPHGVLSTVGVV